MRQLFKTLLLMLCSVCGLIDPDAVSAMSPEDNRSDLALVLAVDASSSIDDNEFNFQLNGIAIAFRQPEIVNAIRSGPIGRIDVALLFWAGRSPQPDSYGWFRIGDEREAERFASLVSAMPRRISGATSVGKAMMAALALLNEASAWANRLCIDLSGDGRETAVPHAKRQSITPSSVRGTAESLHVTINALVIESEDMDLAQWFRRHVVTNDGFVMQIDYADAFSDAIQSKLIKEIRQPATAELQPIP